MKSILKLSGLIFLSTASGFGLPGATIQELSDECDGLRTELIKARHKLKLAERNHVAAEAGFEAAAAAVAKGVEGYQFAEDVSTQRRQMKGPHRIDNLRGGRPHTLKAFGIRNWGKHSGVCAGNLDATTDSDCSGGSGTSCIKGTGTNAKCAVDMHKEQCNALDIGSCAATTGSINTNCAGTKERKECTDLGMGTCAVQTGDTNANCAGKTTRGTCEDEDIGTCATYANVGSNWRCAGKTTRATCYSASIDTAGCIFTPVHECRFTPVEDSGACTGAALCTAVADGPAATCTSTMTAASGGSACTWTQTSSDCEFTEVASTDCVFTDRDISLNVNVGPGVGNEGGSANAQQLVCCTNKMSAGPLNKYTFEIGDYKDSFENYEEVYDTLFKEKEDIRQQERAACTAYAAAARALTA